MFGTVRSYAVASALILLTASALGGCGDERAGGREAEAMLEQAIRKSRSEEYAFYGKSSASRDGDLLYTADTVFTRRSEQWVAADANDAQGGEAFAGWNMIDALERLPEWSARVRFEGAERDDRQLIVAEPSEQDVKAWIRERLVRELEAFAAEQHAADLERITAVAKRRTEALDRLLDQVELESEYRIWVDRTDGLPKRLEATTTLNYTNQRIERRETIQGAYTLEQAQRKNMITEVKDR